MDLDSVADELYAGSRDEFMTLRAERAAQAKSTGDRDLARHITKLRKPSTAAWVINRLAREHPAELSELVDLGARMRDAHQAMDGARMREIAARRRATVQTLLGLARPIAGTASATVFDQVQETLDAAVSSPDVAAGVTSGRLDTAAGLDSTAGFDQLPTATPRPVVAAAPAPEPTTEQAAEPSTAEPEVRDERAERLRAHLERARAEATAADAEHEQARRAAAEAAADAEAAVATTRDLRSQLARAERRERRAREALADARRTAEAAGRAASAARRAIARIEGP